MSQGFGGLARIGHLYPSGGLCDYEVQLMAPEGVQFVTTRLPFRRTGLGDDVEMVADLAPHCRLLADAEVDLIAMNCTAATIVVGPAEINRCIREATGIASVTTAEAVVAALLAARVSRPALLTPYPDEVVEAERRALLQEGFNVRQSLGRPCASPIDQATIPQAEWFRMALDADRKRVDGLLISCAGIQLADTVAAIERELGLPVVASNHALLWYVLQSLDIAARPEGYGALLAGVFDAGGSRRRWRAFSNDPMRRVPEATPMRAGDYVKREPRLP